MYFQDILENEDIKLDNMFMASLVGDIVRVSYIDKLQFYINFTIFLACSLKSHF